MVKKYRTLSFDSDLNDLITKCKLEYLKHHPEMREINITKSKILYEVLNYYLTN